MNIYKYKIIKPFALFETLFLEGDEIYIQEYDPVEGRHQMLFTSDKKYLGKITSSTYWALEKANIEKVK